MGKGNGRVFTVAARSKQSYVCSLVDTAGEELPMKHLLDDVYDKKDPACQECGVCAAFKLKVKPKAKAPAPNVVPIAASRGMVRPHGCDATRKRTIRRVSSGLGG